MEKADLITCGTLRNGTHNDNNNNNTGKKDEKGKEEKPREYARALYLQTRAFAATKQSLSAANAMCHPTICSVRARTNQAGSASTTLESTKTIIRGLGSAIGTRGSVFWGEKAEAWGGRKKGGEKARPKVGRVESTPSATNYGKGGDHISDPFYFRSTAENLPSVTRYGLLNEPQYVSAFLAQLRFGVLWASVYPQ